MLRPTDHLWRLSSPQVITRQAKVYFSQIQVVVFQDLLSISVLQYEIHIASYKHYSGLGMRHQKHQILLRQPRSQAPPLRNAKLNLCTRREPGIVSHVGTAKGRMEVEQP